MAAADGGRGEIVPATSCCSRRVTRCPPIACRGRARACPHRRRSDGGNLFRSRRHGSVAADAAPRDWRSNALVLNAGHPRHRAQTVATEPGTEIGGIGGLSRRGGAVDHPAGRTPNSHGIT
ncbi:hypothetical protein F2981_29125 (plasmid) [Sinorhizobium meliloti]|nr:hypothetical protein [Sinorhizobium meliloti]